MLSPRAHACFWLQVQPHSFTPTGNTAVDALLQSGNIARAGPAETWFLSQSDAIDLLGLSHEGKAPQDDYLRRGTTNQKAALEALKRGTGYDWKNPAFTSAQRWQPDGEFFC